MTALQTPLLGKLQPFARSLEARLPEQARWILRQPAWVYGSAALGLIYLVGRLSGLGDAAQPPAASTLPNTTFLAFDAFTKMGVVLALFLIGVQGLRRWRKYLPGEQGRQITVLETKRLSQRQALHLVKLGDQMLLIGATDQGLTLLTEVEPPRPEPSLDFSAEFALRQAAVDPYADLFALTEPEAR